MYLHSNIRVLRKKAGLTQIALAEKLGKTNVTVGDYERGRALPPLNIILELCDILSVDLQTLVLHDIERKGIDTTYTPPTTYTEVDDQLRTQQHINKLQQQRLQELEREIRERAPELAKRLGL